MVRSPKRKTSWSLKYRWLTKAMATMLAGAPAPLPGLGSCCPLLARRGLRRPGAADCLMSRAQILLCLFVLCCSLIGVSLIGVSANQKTDFNLCRLASKSVAIWLDCWVSKSWAALLHLSQLKMFCVKCLTFVVAKHSLWRLQTKIKKHRYMLYIQYIYIYIWFHNIKITIERDECTSHCSALDIVVDAWWITNYCK